MDPELFIPDRIQFQFRIRLWKSLGLGFVSGSGSRPYLAHFFQIKNLVPKLFLSNVRSNIVKSNIQFYIVSVRTFVIPFYFGYGSKSAKGTGYGMQTESGSGPANAKSSGSVRIRIHKTVERKEWLAVLAVPIPPTCRTGNGDVQY